MELLFASSNAHKLEEICAMAGSKLKITGMREAGILEEIPEDAPDLKGNAELKARFVFRKTGKNCFADDSGLEVDYLNGRPGVHSARYGGLPPDPGKNIARLLEEMKGTRNRSARFRTVICLILEGKEFFFEGAVEGKITRSPRGREGFGYDPVFIPDGFETTFAEMPPGEKDRISHRRMAVEEMLKVFGF